MNILLAVSGSISAYKSLDICRAYIKKGHRVRVILTKGALQFVVPQVFLYLGAEQTYLPEDDFLYPQNVQSGRPSSSVLHIELAQWASRLVIAPASANTLSNLAQGAANDLLSSIFLSFSDQKPIIIYPAMNTHMLEHPFTKENISILDKLKSLGNLFVHPPTSGLLACGDTGAGKLPEIDVVVESSLSFALPRGESKRRRVLITAGATLSPLDPVRFLTNASSGLTGFLLATEFLKRGDFVHVVAGKFASDKLESLQELPQFQLTRTTTTSDMAEIVQANFPRSDIYISTAAISDIEFNDTSNIKLKKDKMTSGSLSIKQSIDILEGVLSVKNKRHIVIGFAAETSLDDEILLSKWQRKPVDLLIGTQVHNGLLPNSTCLGFKNDQADYAIVQHGKVIERKKMEKHELANYILSHCP